MVITNEVEDDGIAACAVSWLRVSMKGYLVVVVEHDPAVSRSILCAQDVNCKEIGAIDFADEMRGVDIKAVA